MQYGEAFTKRGYALTAPRQDWSAERDDGVCITLWRTEIDWKTLTMDSRVRGGPLGDWSGLPGNAKRIRHATRALDGFGGMVDAIIVEDRTSACFNSSHNFASRISSYALELTREVSYKMKAINF